MPLLLPNIFPFTGWRGTRVKSGKSINYNTSPSKIQRVSSGDSNTITGSPTKEEYELFEKLYDAYAPRAYGFLLKQTGSKEKAELILTNVFLRVWRNLKTFDPDSGSAQKFTILLLSTCKPHIKDMLLRNSSPKISLAT